MAKHVMRYTIRVFMTYPRMFAHGQPPPFIHHTQLMGEVPQTLSQCMVIFSGSDRPELASLLGTSVKYELYALMAQYETYNNEVELLAAFQAYILYSIFLLFSGDGRTRNPGQDENVMVGLQDMSMALMKSGLLLNAETQSIMPSWEAWIAVEAKRRAIQASHTLMWAWSLQQKYPPFGCREVGFMPTPSPKVLWQARDDEEWRGHYNKWLDYWRNGGAHRVEELMLIKPDIELDERTQRWLEEADEFGLVLMAQGMSVW
ncbi:hypothetical protein PV08_04848 [Exophiala spinifera]|uniref:Transcription factor domain-containing protein n=1 Tax=Exophiala spinifera TaxID=91928 RepID=A0A0D2BF89_9EURO|nr:uncharacterized protein PV08_04848 [Exophiala spinifera]KIW17653.1 hypothetical protein PV08_04848 [Exophiala spinifera]